MNILNTLNASLQHIVYADPVNVKVQDPLSGKFTNLQDIFGFAVNVVIGVGWALVLVMLAVGFVMYVLSKGEKTAVENAQKWITYSVVGGAGLFFIMVIRNLIPNLLGANTNNLGGGGNIVP